MTYGDTVDLMYPHVWVAKFFYAIGFLDGLSCTLLIMGAAIGLFLKPIPRPFAVTVEVLAIVFLVTSSIVASAYVTELWVVLYRGNRYEIYTYFHARGAMSSTAVLYLLNLLYMLLPQCFWNPRLRNDMLAVLLITIIASLPHWLERWTVWGLR